MPLRVNIPSQVFLISLERKRERRSRRKIKIEVRKLKKIRGAKKM